MELKIKSLRKAAGMRQADLAEAVGVSRRTMISWESGARYPDAEAMCHICDVLGCTPNDLCGWYETHPRQDVAPAPVQRRYDAASDAVKRAVDAVLDSEKRGCARAAHAAGDLSAALSA